MALDDSSAPAPSALDSSAKGPSSHEGPAAAALEADIQSALRDNVLSEEYAGLIHQLLEQPAEDWPRCCGSDCDPCVTALARVVLRVRRLQADRR
jgi:hypothetical protein